MMGVAKVVGTVLGIVLLVVGGYLAGVRLGVFGAHEGPGEVTAVALSPEVVAARSRPAAPPPAPPGVPPAPPAKQILFGDLHVHTTFSSDAFLWSLPLMQGEGPHPVADACDYARFCSALDFWSINDHAEASTPRKWQETKETIRRCNAVAGDPAAPDVSAFIGWEWSQVGRSAADHYGHKNVIFRDLGDDQVPTRPIGAAGIATEGLRHSRAGASPWLPLLDLAHRQRYYDLRTFLAEIQDVPPCPEGVGAREIGPDCYESAATPRELFDKLDRWGFEAIVIPHGTTWGFYTPPGSTLDKQLRDRQHDPRRQILFEIMSGHGNSEEYRDWRAVHLDRDGKASCPQPSDTYMPSCWRAGDIIRQRCRDAGGDPAVCEDRAGEARQRYAEAGVAGHLTVTGEPFEDWLDAGQCRDCFLPAFNYRPGSSAQYGLAISNLDDPKAPQRFRWGFIASSDNHRARPGTGYKERDRLATTEANGAASEEWRSRVVGPPEAPAAETRALAPEQNAQEMGFGFLEAERQSSFFLTGGLVAVHAAGRGRDAIWDALERREVYGTSGDRILLWFDLLSADGSTSAVPMGGSVETARTPRFVVRAVGAFEQKPGCPSYSVTALGPERLQRLCRGECYHPADRRKRITRIEVVRIRPQTQKGEPVAPLIEDPWRVLPCPGEEAGCVVTFEDLDFPFGGRDTVYYVRAIEEPSPAVNGGQLRCERDAFGGCLAVHPCYGDYRSDPGDDCLVPVEERAWSSPIYLDFGAGR